MYFFGLLIILAGSMLLLGIDGKSQAFILLNTYHSFFLDNFFIYYTYLGDGIFALCLTALLFFYFKKKQMALALLLSFSISGLVAQTIKNLIAAPRPRLFFESNEYAHFINGVSLANNSSFPSGHTTSAFAVATVLALMIKDKRWQIFLLLIASIVGYSRIYLAQHFLLDVIIGAIIGTGAGAFAVYLANTITSIKKLG